MSSIDALLLTPGPTQVPPSVREIMALPMIHHRTEAFQEILASVQEKLQKVLMTREPVITLAASGTGALEASIVNCLSKEDTVIAFTAGKWGERYRDIAASFCKVRAVEKAYGRAFSHEDVQAELKRVPKAKAVLMTHCETSTGVVNPIEEIAKIVQETDALLLVDAISSVGADPLKMDAWGIDVVVSGSQKGLMLPPGLAFIALNGRAREALKHSNLPKYYFDLNQAMKALEKNDTPFTSAVSLIRGLEESLEIILKEGLEAVWKRHLGAAEWVRAEARRLSLEVLAERPSSALTAFKMPKGVLSTHLIKAMRDKHSVIMADGQGELKGKIVRMAHMGYFGQKDIELGMKALGAVLADAGVKT